MLEFLIISAAVGWMFFVLYSPKFNYLDGEHTLLRRKQKEED